MERIRTPPVVVEDLQSLKGQYLRNTRDQGMYKVLEVGRQGVTAYQVTHYGGDPFGPEILITWRAVKAIYAIMVHAGEIDEKALH